MKITGRIIDASVDFKNYKPRVTFEVNEKADFFQFFDELKDKDKLSIEVKPYREKRSLNANNYAWAIITQIADVVRANKEEIYLEMLRRYGQSELISVVAHIPIHEYIKYCEEAGESSLNGKLFKHYKVYKGSSEFDTREMSIFIDGIVSEAKELGIQTETPDQIALMKARWGEK